MYIYTHQCIEKVYITGTFLKLLIRSAPDPSTVETRKIRLE